LREIPICCLETCGFPRRNISPKGEEDGEGGSTYTHPMKDAVFMMPTPRVLANVVDQLDAIDMADRDTKGDLYEYMLGKIASAGQNRRWNSKAM
jgi:type I restriction enzyme M protein